MPCRWLCVRGSPLKCSGLVDSVSLLDPFGHQGILFPEVFADRCVVAMGRGVELLIVGVHVELSGGGGVGDVVGV